MAGDKAMEVRVTLSSPLRGEGLLPLDSVLAAACSMEGMGQAFWRERSRVRGEALSARKGSRRIPLARVSRNGAIEAVEVIPRRMSEDWSLFRPGGVPTRPIPVRMGLREVAPGSTRGWHGYRPPYWDERCQAECWLPPRGE